MKKQLLLFVLILLPLVASAETVEIDGIYYNLITKGKIAEVTSNPSEYKGDIIIPETITYEGNDYNVTSIGYRAFAYCFSLVSVIIPNSIVTIKSAAFEQSRALTSVIIPSSVITINFDTFNGCSGLTSVTIPNSVTTIEQRAFYGCSSLTSLIIPNNVTNITLNSFAYCSGLTSLTLGNNVTTIEQGAFIGCTSLTSLNIPNSVKSIDKYAFESCNSLTSITIGSNLTSIGAGAFTLCNNLSAVYISDLQSWCKISFKDYQSNPLYYAKYFYLNGEEIKDLVIPNNVTSIASSAFFGYKNLASVTISNSVTSIGDYAFYGCSGLTSITMGNGIKIIYERAFGSCPELTHVYCYALNTPSTNSNAFENSYIEYATLHVPLASVNAYKDATPWKNFKEVVALDGETPETSKCEKPTISYANGQLKMSCATEGVEYVTDITDTDVKKHYGAAISLTATYNISVYATKSGYDNSDVVTATLCWIDAMPQTEGITDGVAQIAARPILIKTDSGFITVEGIDDKTNVCIFTTDGKQIGSAISQNNVATVATSLQPGSIAIVKVGEKSVKVVIH